MKWCIALMITINFMFPCLEAFSFITSTTSYSQRISPSICTSSFPTIQIKRESNRKSFSFINGKKDAREEAAAASAAAKKERVKKEKDDVIEVDGTVIESLPNAMFRCTIDGAAESQPPILATISGKIRKNFVKILVGDKVTIELSPYDLTRGRITYRKR